MKKLIICVLVIIVVMCELVVSANKGTRCENVKNSLSNLRKRRHLTFPAGSSLVLTLSLLKALLTHIPSGWNVAVEIDVIYPLLSPEVMNAFFRKKFLHRQKREFWNKIEDAFAGYNMNGRACLYRSICEGRNLLAPKGKSLVHDILRAIFTAPLHEAAFREEVNETYDELLESDVCERIHECPVSLLDVILSMNRGTGSFI